ncbi:uncharacterized protein LOC122849837 [Aphidius gifuensis]|uniref:uncharacterized protein LOC122849837 n=1 Tax=Aphidius gifuensis TaxID=684658 RepID=UPI001CDBECC8|nr:uncharacterized protein LOC122849837 [Aphidius gifuensis]
MEILKIYDIIEICKYLNRSERVAFIQQCEETGGELLLTEHLDTTITELSSDQIEWILRYNKYVIDKLSICGDVNFGVILSAIRECEFLEDIVLIGSDVTGEELKCLINTVKNLKKLDITASYRLEKDQLISAINLGTNITNLILYDVPAVDDDVLIACSHIQHLDVGGTEITDEGLIIFANNNQNLKSIGLEETRRITGEAVDNIAEKFEQRQQAVIFKIDRDLSGWVKNKDQHKIVSFEINWQD